MNTWKPLCYFLNFPNKSSIVRKEAHTPCETVQARLHTTSVALYSQVLREELAFKPLKSKLNWISDSLFTRQANTTKYSLKCITKPGAWTQPHTQQPWDTVFFGHECLCTPWYTHMPFVFAGAQLVTSSWGEFISDWSAAAWRLSKAVLSSSCLKLPEPTDHLPAVGICLPRPEFASLYHGCLPSLRGSALHLLYQCEEKKKIPQVIQVFTWPTF